MINALINGLLKIITTLLNVFLLPINLLIEGLFPDMTEAIGVFNNFVTNYLSSPLSYFFNLLPPIFRSILTLWLTFLIGYYTFHYTYLGIIKIWAIIQKIKFW